MRMVSGSRALARWDRALNPRIERHCRAATEHGRQICLRCSLTRFTRSNLTCTCCRMSRSLVKISGSRRTLKLLLNSDLNPTSVMPCKLALSTAVDGEMGTISTGTLRLGVETEDRLEGLLAVTALAAKRVRRWFVFTR
jgi:hypothetical protein